MLNLNREDFLWYLALDVTANWICETHCLALDGFNLNTVHKLSNKEKYIGSARIQTRGYWMGSKNAATVLYSPPPPLN